MKKYESLYQDIKKDILNGYLKKGDRLDSIRLACKKLNVSKTTVLTAYEKLMSEGFIESLEKVGFVVCIEENQIQLHQKIQNYHSNHKNIVYEYDYRLSSVSIDSFEMDAWKRYMKLVLNDKNVMSSYGLSQGEYELREALCKYVYQNRNILATPEQVVIGSNYQSLLYIFCGMLDKNLTIGVSELVDEEALLVFQSYGFQVKKLSIDSFVKDIEKFKIDVLYINTTCFTKDKRSMSIEIRNKLIKMSDVLILEDDYNGELVYASKVKYSLFSKCDHCIYINSFSRLLLPSLRIGYMILNKEYIIKYLKLNLGPTTSKIEQLAFSHYIVDGHLQKRVRKLIREYSTRHVEMKKILDKQFDIPFYLNEAYMAYCFEWDKDEVLFSKCCESNGIGLNVEDGVVSISFASIPLEKMELGLVRLAQIVKEC